jgi:hypothetical protein
MVVQGDKQMARTTKQTKTRATPGFAIEIKDDTELGLAILAAEFGDGDGTGGYSTERTPTSHLPFVSGRAQRRAPGALSTNIGSYV